MACDLMEEQSNKKRISAIGELSLWLSMTALFVVISTMGVLNDKIFDYLFRPIIEFFGFQIAFAIQVIILMSLGFLATKILVRRFV